ncbi:hypothetical protein NIES37_15260 [Tolypothrix tenuis PCC 7101]|uniref:Uncharacterized protein n=1 Tax=Tolypothrix tenuis PCC 7101 TaxID=231146 RepID=A0A1Z4MVU5_9CYAN|nr:hypothetical protein [Aulosira sp. FACHB-113]BAY97584.1 hypothetical protein NIES37_15260 [Tolypothrix tenuis PCC 7101]BAZ71908.1 hypothetical protein NIES50_04570 [Aulosira laxa NIES-50]
MFELGWFSAKLFFKGRLLRDPIHFVRQIAIATGINSLILLLLEQTSMPFWLPIVISSLATGATMPFLLKDFKTK